MLHILTVLELNTFQKKIRKFICNKRIQTSNFRIQAYYSIMCEYFSIGFINFMLKGKTLTDFTNVFAPNN